jgi:alpha-glucuronidase
MELAGCIQYAVSSFKTASNATAIVTSLNSTAGTASTRINFPTGKYDIAVNYYDVIGDVSHWKLFSMMNRSDNRMGIMSTG